MRPDSSSSPATAPRQRPAARALKPALRAMATRYGEIAMPTEIVHGTADAVVPFDSTPCPSPAKSPGRR